MRVYINCIYSIRNCNFLAVLGERRGVGVGREESWKCNRQIFFSFRSVKNLYDFSFITQTNCLQFKRFIIEIYIILFFLPIDLLLFCALLVAYWLTKGKNYY